MGGWQLQLQSPALVAALKGEQSMEKAQAQENVQQG